MQLVLSNMYKIEIYSERVKGASVFEHTVEIYNKVGANQSFYVDDDIRNFVIVLLDNSEQFRLNELTSGEGGYVDSVGREWECQTLVYVNKEL